MLTQWWPGLGIYGAALGVIGGALGQTIILLPGLAALRRRPWPVWNPLDCHLREVARLLIPNGLSATVNYACLVMDTAFASLVQEPVALVAIITPGCWLRYPLHCSARQWRRRSFHVWLPTATPVIGKAAPHTAAGAGCG